MVSSRAGKCVERIRQAQAYCPNIFNNALLPYDMVSFIRLSPEQPMPVV
jgi:hypothetical protein